METFTYLLQSDTTVQDVRDYALIAVLLLVFVVLFVFAVMGIILFRQMRRVAKRMETALARVESGIEKFETVADSVSTFAGTMTTTVGAAGVRGFSKLFSKWFHGTEQPEDEDEDSGDNGSPRKSSPPSEKD